MLGFIKKFFNIFKRNKQEQKPEPPKIIERTTTFVKIVPKVVDIKSPSKWLPNKIPSILTCCAYRHKDLKILCNGELVAIIANKDLNSEIIDNTLNDCIDTHKAISKTKLFDIYVKGSFVYIDLKILCC